MLTVCLVLTAVTGLCVSIQHRSNLHKSSRTLVISVSKMCRVGWLSRNSIRTDFGNVGHRPILDRYIEKSNPGAGTNLVANLISKHISTRECSNDLLSGSRDEEVPSFRQALLFLIFHTLGFSGAYISPRRKVTMNLMIWAAVLPWLVTLRPQVQFFRLELVHIQSQLVRH